MEDGLTIAIVDEEIEGVVITSVGELVIGGWELLEALSRDGGEVSGELRVLGEHHRPPSHEAVDEPALLLSSLHHSSI